ncbi:MAG TPA: hypothetical protein VNL95_01230 [Dehalococcoidia bacterium]|nr:hypothetical protein [Dehalococcoidia bacterium]
MRVSEFLELVRTGVPARLPGPLREFRWRLAPSLLQVYYWYPAVHYELWLQRRQGLVEVGLHFEGEREHNYRWAAALAGEMPRVLAALGRPAELEEWTGWWTRLHYTVPMAPLDEAFAQECAQHLAGLIAGLQPLLEELRREHRIPESRSTGPPRQRRHRPAARP